jgi:D-alanyl-D-alanine dipeptidase
MEEYNRRYVAMAFSVSYVRRLGRSLKIEPVHVDRKLSIDRARHANFIGQPMLGYALAFCFIHSAVVVALIVLRANAFDVPFYRILG